MAAGQRRVRRYAGLVSACAVATGVATLTGGAGVASASGTLVPGNLLVSTSTYQTANITAGTTQLPPGCTTGCVTAVASGTYPQVFNNAAVDASFGVTSPIVLNQITPAGAPVSTIEIPNSTDAGITSSSDQMVTSFSSKSEVALNESTSGNSVTFMGYNAPVDAVDVSNSNTPGAVDSTNPVPSQVYRVVATLGADGSLHYTETNAYSGNNGRAAVLDDAGTGMIYTAGNAGNGANPEPAGVVLGAGAQILAPSSQPEASQAPGAPTPVGNFNITQLGNAADKSAKDDNFRGLTLSNNVLYNSKGSGGNGVNTVYFLDTTGTACPNGVGLPSPTATLPTASTLSYSNSNAALGLTASNPGLVPTNMCILKGFPTVLAKTPTAYPFGIYFASPTVMYVADEGSGANTYSAATNTYTAAAAQTTAGLQKWVFNGTQWNLAYTLQSGLNLGQPYTVAGYPTGTNGTSASKTTGTTGLPWAPAVDGLRNLVGRANGDGTVSFWATTSTVSGSGDQGTDPNGLVSITDTVGATSLPASETFSSVIAPANGVVVRGVSFTPGTSLTPPPQTPEVPWAPLIPLSALLAGGVLVWRRKSQPAHQSIAV